MASSSSSTSPASSSSPATSTPSAAPVVPTPAVAPAASAGLGGAHAANASAPGVGVYRSAALDLSRPIAPLPINFSSEHWLFQPWDVPPSVDSGLESAETSSAFAPVMWSRRYAPSTPTDASRASAPSSSTTPASAINQAPNASGSGPAVATSGDTDIKLVPDAPAAPVFPNNAASPAANAAVGGANASASFNSSAPDMPDAPAAPVFATNAAAPAASAALGGAPGPASAPTPAASASEINATSTALGVRRSTTRGNKPKKVDPRTIFPNAAWGGTGGRAPAASTGLGGAPGADASAARARVPYEKEFPPFGTMLAPVMSSTEAGSSSSPSAPFPSSSTVASAPADTTPASAAASSNTLVPSAATSSGPLRTDAPPFIPSTATGTPSPGAAPTASATTSAHGAVPTSFGVNLPAVPLYSDPMWACATRAGPAAAVWCSECGLRPAEIVASPCGHWVLCAPCYNRFVCPWCGARVVWPYQ